jgi:glycosyltransferase involved in cell wall biosynthesis
LPIEVWFLRLARSLRIKIVYTVHNVLPQDTGDKHRAAYRSIYRLADRLICHDQDAADRIMREFQVTPERISIIPHGPLLESPPANPLKARERLGLPTDRAVVLWQGIVRPYKGVSFLLDAWKVVQSYGDKAVLAVVGNGDDEILRSIRENVDSLGLRSSVKLDFRFVAVDELNDYYAAADVLVYPYREITTSGALMTGIGHGKAIIATRQPAFRHVLQDGQNALMVDYGNTRELADGLIRLISEPELRERLGVEARKSYVKGPQWSDIAMQTLSCYKVTMKEHGVVPNDGNQVLSA